MEPGFMDEIDCGNFFDEMDDLIEFPPENMCGDGSVVNSGDCDDFSSIWKDALPTSECDPLLMGSHSHSAADLSAEISVPYEDIVQLEWLSTFMEDSFSGKDMTIRKDSTRTNKEPPSHKPFQTSSPVSVLESRSSSSSSSYSAGKHMPCTSPNHGRQRARTKRRRPTTFNPRAPIQLISPSSSTEIHHPKFVRAEQKKKRKIKPSSPLDPPVPAVRKCLHCEITKTPQWRAGPMGPKTLCNACGVRYKSGRLFPEYRPAASPTFVPALHSNSHKKVVEMRCRVVQENAITAANEEFESGNQS